MNSNPESPSKDLFSQKRTSRDSEEPEDNKRSRVASSGSPRTSGHLRVNDLLGKQEQHLQNVKDLLQEMRFFVANPNCAELENRRFVSETLKLCRDVRAKVSPRRPRSEEPLEYDDVGSASSGNESISSVEDVGYNWMFANKVVAFFQPTMESAAQTLHTLRQQSTESGEGTPASSVRQKSSGSDEGPEADEDELETVNQCLKDEGARKKLFFWQVAGRDGKIDCVKLAPRIQFLVGRKKRQFLKNVLFESDDVYNDAMANPEAVGKTKKGEAMFDRMLKFALWSDEEIKMALTSRKNSTCRKYTDEENAAIKAVFEENDTPDEETLQGLAIKCNKPLNRISATFSKLKYEKNKNAMKAAAALLDEAEL